MGLLVEGKWVDRWYDTDATEGAFVRSEAQFRNWVTPDGKPGPSGVGGFNAQPDRYHLYVSYACPWAHRTLIFRVLKGLSHIVDVTVVHPHMLKNGWELRDNAGNSSDPLYGARFLHELYTRAQAHYSGRVTVPVLWDKQQQTIVSNESAEILRMFNSSFEAYSESKTDYYPPAQRAAIDALNEQIHRTVNNGVYCCGFATRQPPYEAAFRALFATLDKLESRLARRRYLLGEHITEADWRLFTTLLRFDAVYYSHFKCNLHRIVDYPQLWAYVRDLYQQPGIAATVHMDHIKQHYYVSQTSINPQQIVPLGPELDFLEVHHRDRQIFS